MILYLGKVMFTLKRWKLYWGYYKLTSRYYVISGRISLLIDFKCKKEKVNPEQNSESLFRENQSSNQSGFTKESLWLWLKIFSKHHHSMIRNPKNCEQSITYPKNGFLQKRTSQESLGTFNSRRIFNIIYFWKCLSFEEKEWYTKWNS